MPVDGYVKIFGTTRRAGDQSPGFLVTSPQKLQMERDLVVGFASSVPQAEG